MDLSGGQRMAQRLWRAAAPGPQLLASLTASAASMMPGPQPPGQLAAAIGWAVRRRMSLTWLVVFGTGATACISATTPATCGAAIEVPDMKSKALLPTVDTVSYTHLTLPTILLV